MILCFVTRRMTLPTLVLIAGLSTSTLAQGASPQSLGPRSPEWVVRMFFAERSFPEKANHITGEFREHYASTPTMGSQLPSDVLVVSRPLRQDTARAIFATTLSDTANVQEWYAYLRREEGVWKLEAVRTLAFPPLHYILLDSLRASHRRGALPDSVVPAMEAMQLAIRSDSALKQYVRDNEPALRSLAERFAALPTLTVIAVDPQIRWAGTAPESEREALAAGLRRLRLGALLRNQLHPGCIFLKIGGVTDNSVGYIRAGHGCQPPEMSPEEFIYVEQIAPGWFIYKTT